MMRGALRRGARGSAAYPCDARYGSALCGGWVEGDGLVARCSSHGEHRAIRAPNDVLGGAPQDEMLDPRPSVGSQYDKVGRLFIGASDDLHGGRSSGPEAVLDVSHFFSAIVRNGFQLRFEVLFELLLHTGEVQLEHPLEGRVRGNNGIHNVEDYQ